MIYLNPAGLSPFHPEVQEEVTRALNSFSHLLYSESGIHYYRETLQQCRRTIAAWLALQNEQRLAFMPNATTACSLILSRMKWNPGDILLTTTHENSTILQELTELSDRGVEIISLDPDSPTGLLPQLETTIHTRPVRAILLSHVSHLDGRIFPITTIQNLAQSNHALFIVDGAQAVGHIPVTFQYLRPHAYFFPGHKWCAGPMGTGALILDEQCEVVLSGVGGRGNCLQEVQPWSRYELGTQNIGLIAGFARACTLNSQKGSHSHGQEEFRTELKTCFGRFSGIKILEWDGPHAPGILSFVCLDEKTERFIRNLSSTHSLAWKAFFHPSFPSQLSIRLSWTTATPKEEVLAALD